MTITTRSKRVSAFGAGASTPATVAPGSYALEQATTSFGARTQRPLFSSFATSEKRNLNENKTTSAITPGLQPNSFHRFSFSVSSTIFRSSSVQENPGPGSYLRASTSPHSNNQREHLAANKFAHLLKPSVPAIPQRQQSYGYVMVGAELQLQPPPDEVYSGVGHDTVGPAAYSRHGPIWNAKRNVAPSLKSTAKREVWEETKQLCRVPGPGHYHESPATDATVPAAPASPPTPTSGMPRPRIGARRSQHQAARQSAVFASKVPILPAPKPMGQYDADRDQELLAKDERAERYRQDQHRFGAAASKTEAFGSTTGRAQLSSQMNAPFSHPSYIATPGPGRYGGFANGSGRRRDSKTSGNASEFVRHRTDGVGFSCATERPCLAPTRAPAAPGPGAYKSETPRSMTQAVKGKLAIGRNGVFGTTSERQMWGELERMDVQEVTPGPGAYSERVPVSNTHYLNSAAFKSSSTRFAKNANPHVHCVGSQVSPAVGQYNISTGFSVAASNVVGADGSLANASDAADGGNSLLSPRVSFLSTTERSVFDAKDERDLPGPGAYKDRSEELGGGFTRSRDVRLTVGNEARFRVKPTVPETVGPGTYSMPDTVGTKSFNVTMARKGKTKSPQSRTSSSPFQSSLAMGSGGP
ncbi:hypothetical protein BBJ28_00012322 [Nothophytophthora sp. Chile5]|nr:hypothetical protein BBJ28_00012322 [Nothophytophthora sp. Chile5]